MIARIAPWRGKGAISFAKATDKIINISKFTLTMQKGAAATEYFHFAAVPFGAIESAEHAINALPRRILGYRAPEALFEAELDRLYGAPV
jgi:hypothetical protein